MNEEKLEQYIDELIEAVKSGMDFAGDQAPLYVEELLSYAVYYHTIYIIGFSIAFLICLFVTINTKKSWDNASYVDSLEWGVATYLAGIISAIFAILITSNITSLIKVFVAPRVYLLEKIMNLI